MQNNFLDKKIAVIGLSVEGLETVKYLATKKANVTVCDRKNEKEFSTETLNLLKKLKVKINFGPNYLDNLDEYSQVFRTPGMPLWDKKLSEAKEKGVKIKSLTKLFFDLCPGKIIGVTGTKGKGTTATLIKNILKADKKTVFLGGNIGKPLISDLPKIDRSSWVILEISSFQLEDLEKSPHIAVVLNITVDHLASSSPDSPNYHKNREEYISAKRKIVMYQNPNDFAVLNTDYQTSLDFEKYTKAKIWYFGKIKEVSRGSFVENGNIYLKAEGKKELICQSDKVLLKGDHNLENITAAITVSHIAGVKNSIIRKTVLNFKGLEHRLELVRIINGVTYYNDSFATTPETTIAAIKSFKEPIILICGGSDKGSDYTKMGWQISNSLIKTVILIGQMSAKIGEAIDKSKTYKGEIIRNIDNMKDIVKKVSNIAKKGNVILLSPGCASFDMFKNYKDRGNQFKNEVKKIKK